MTALKYLLSQALVLLACFSHAEELPKPQDEAALHSQTVEAFQKKDWVQLESLTAELMKLHPTDPDVLFNAGVAALNLEKGGIAAAYWRKALFLSPGHSRALEGLLVLEDKMNLQPLSSLSFLYRRIPLTPLLFLTWLAFTGLIFFLIKHRKSRGQNQLILAGLCGTLFLSVGLFSAKYYADVFHTNHGTLVLAENPLRLNPGEDSPTLLDLSEGQQVEILRDQGEWVQVRRLSAEVGWVPRASVFAQGFF